MSKLTQFTKRVYVKLDSIFIFRKVLELFDATYMRVLSKEIVLLSNKTKSNSLRVLDVGAGNAQYWVALERKLPEINLEVILFDAIKTTNDGNKRFVLVAEQGEVPEDLKIFEEKSFDLVVFFDLIEHLSKEDGYKLLYEIDRITKGTAIAFTPNGFVQQPPAPQNPYNAHLSGWKSGDLRKFGYIRFRGHTGIKFARTAYGLQKKWSKTYPISEIDALLTLLAYRLPKIAFAFSAVKRYCKEG